MINFCYDLLSTPGIGYPNLAKHNAVPYSTSWRQFDNHWPYTIPLRFLHYLYQYRIPYHVHSSLTAPPGSIYPISIGWFDFDCDYFSLIPNRTLKKIINKDIHVLFYYHEGDNPQRIIQRLENLASAYNIGKECYTFVSANSAAENYFPDHEFFFRYVNKNQAPVTVTDQDRKYDFTVLCRTHKWWRATCMTDLLRQGLIDNSLWSYNTNCTINDNFDDNPIEIDTINIRPDLDKFINQGPYKCDNLSEKDHNDHHQVNTDLYTNSYIQIILETHFDADQSNGTFLTEKTWKTIKFGQPFVIIGPSGSIRALNDSGYKTFDQYIENSYDSILDNTQRWSAVIDTVKKIKSDPKKVFHQCIDDIIYNQKLFMSRGLEDLNRIIGKLNVKSN